MATTTNFNTNNPNGTWLRQEGGTIILGSTFRSFSQVPVFLFLLFLGIGIYYFFLPEEDFPMTHSPYFMSEAAAFIVKIIGAYSIIVFSLIKIFFVFFGKLELRIEPWGLLIRSGLGLREDKRVSFKRIESIQIHERIIHERPYEQLLLSVKEGGNIPIAIELTPERRNYILQVLLQVLEHKKADLETPPSLDWSDHLIEY